MFSKKSIKLIVLLLTSGICSVVERSLLACINQRQSVDAITVFGLIIMVLDGVKLFAKSSYELHLRKSMSLFLVSTCLFAALLAGAIFNPLMGVKYFCSTKVIDLVALFGIIEITEFFIFSVTANHFVSTAIIRALMLTCVVEVTWSFFIIWQTFRELIVPDSVYLYSGPSLLRIVATMLMFAGLYLFASEHAPFDLIEAESEVMDGVTTDVSGMWFSISYAGEVAVGLLTLMVFLVCTKTMYAALIWMPALILMSFYGRMFLARFLIYDALELIMTSGIFITTLYAFIV